MGLDGYEVQHGFGTGELGFESLGENEVPRAVLNFAINADDKCSFVPLGVRVVDQAGNVSAELEQLLWLADPPMGARDLVAAPTANPGEVHLSWTPSPDV